MKTPSKRGLSRPKFLGGGSSKITLESLPDDSLNSVLHSKESVRRGSFTGSHLSVSGSIEDLDTVTDSDSISQHARIGFCDTPEGTMERKPGIHSCTVLIYCYFKIFLLCITNLIQYLVTLILIVFIRRVSFLSSYFHSQQWQKMKSILEI